jgi:endonuclease/exonuclease/phosphatase family metal-dependent hydrolase
LVDSSLEVRSVEVPNNELCRLASDHLPLVVEVRVPARPADGPAA